MKTILRNFLSVLRRFKMATFLNVAGLAVAFAAFIVILIQVNYERSFDRCHPTAKEFSEWSWKLPVHSVLFYPVDL